MTSPPKTPTRTLPKCVRPGDLDALRRKLWRAILASELLLETDDETVRLRAVSALTTAAGVYRQVFADSELEARVAELERTARSDAVLLKDAA